MSENDVHLWYSSLNIPLSILQRLWSTLSSDEQKRAKRFCFERERARFVASRVLLRRILAYYTRTEPSKLQFDYGSRGKPSLVEGVAGDRIRFNLAHSNAGAIYALTLDRDIGVDFEAVVPIPEYQQIADRFFSSREKATLQALAGNDKLEAFFKIWTAKEAYLKACGEGLSQPLDSIDVALDRRESLHFLKTRANMPEDSPWSLQHLRPTSRSIAALVVNRSRYSLACWEWPGPQFRPT